MDVSASRRAALLPAAATALLLLPLAVLGTLQYRWLGRYSEAERARRLGRGKAETQRDGLPVELSAKEFQLLRYFVAHRGATLSREELLDRVWGYDATPATRTVDVHVAGLRRKLEDDPRQPRHLLTVHRLGYKFVE